MNRARYQATAAAIALLADAFPKCFSVYELRRRPLKVGIHQDILAALDGTITPAELRNALGVYCSNPGYLSHMLKGAWRLDLDGEPAGGVTAAEEADAKTKLISLRAKQKNRTAQAKVQAPPAKRSSFADLKAAAQARKPSARHGAGGRP
jgi:ProP effector